MKVQYEIAQNNAEHKRNRLQIWCTLGQPNPWTVQQCTAPSVLQGLQIYTITIKTLLKVGDLRVETLNKLELNCAVGLNMEAAYQLQPMKH